MTRKPLVAIAAAAACIAAAAPAFAHHSFAMFDRTKEVELKDVTVKDWQWTNPHAWLYVFTAKGEPYSVECGNPGILRRQGWQKTSLKPGDKVTVYLSPLKSGEKGGSLLAVVLPDGKMLGARLSEQQSENNGGG